MNIQLNSKTFSKNYLINEIWLNIDLKCSFSAIFFAAKFYRWAVKKVCKGKGESVRTLKKNFCLKNFS